MKWPKIILIVSSCYVTLSFVLYYVIDLKNFFGLRDFLLRTEGVYFYFTYTPFFFQHYGRNGGFAEIIQWSLLAMSILISIYYAGKVSANKKLTKFLLLFGLGMMLMLLEDAGDTRHFLMSYVQWAAGEPDQGLYGTIFEATYFLLIGGLPVFAIWRYGSAIKEYGKAHLYVILGIVSYAFAASLSFIGTAFDMLFDFNIYTKIGEIFREYSLRIGGEDLRIIWDNWDAQNWLFQTNFYLMDSLVEENIEIIGGAFFLSAMVALAAAYKEKNKSNKSEFMLN